jgi:hypothetical protein
MSTANRNMLAPDCNACCRERVVQLNPPMPPDILVEAQPVTHGSPLSYFDASRLASRTMRCLLQRYANHK